MGEHSSTKIKIFRLTKEEKQRLERTRAKSSEIEKEAKDVISSHLNAIKELAKR